MHYMTEEQAYKFILFESSEGDTFRTWEDFVNKGYRANSVVQSCVRIRANTLNEAFIKVVNNNGEDDVEHPFVRLMKQPNPIMSEAVFWRTVSTYRDIGGYCLVLKGRQNNRGGVIALWPLRPNQLTPRVNGYGLIESWKDISGKTYPASDVIIFNSDYVDPDSYQLAESPIKLLSKSLNVLAALSRLEMTAANNGGAPGYVMKTVTKPSPEQQENFAQRWRQLFRINNGAPLVMSKDQELDKLGSNIGEIDFAALAKPHESRICGVYGLHPTLVMTQGGLESSTYNNMQTAYREYTTLVRIPTWVAWADTLTVGMQQEYPDIVIEFNTSSVAALTNDPDAALYPTIAAWNANMLTLNEARDKIGIPAVDAADGDMYKTEIDLSFIGGGQAERGAGVGSRYEAKAEPDDMDIYYRAANDELDGYASLLAADVEKMLMDVVEFSIEEQRSRKGTKTLKSIVSDFMVATAAKRGKMVRTLIDKFTKQVGGNLKTVTSRYNDISATAARRTNDNITMSIGTIRDEVREFAEANSEVTADVLAGKIRNHFGSIAQGRANAIAATTVRAVSTDVALETAKIISDDEEVTIKKTWLSRRDGRVRSAHASMDGQTVDVDEDFVFPSGNKTPGPAVSGTAAEVVNCRCVMVLRRKNG